MSKTATILRGLKSTLKRKPRPNRFLKKVSGVIHVGANIGQERKRYAACGLRVVWIEPIPEVFETLKANLRGFPRQTALKCLVSDQDNVEYQFHIASNEGESSSTLDLNLHKDIWPKVVYERTITLRSKTLPSLLKDEYVDPSEYDALVVDTQGTELLVLKGAVPILRNFTYIKTEATDYESYTDCCQLADITSFLAHHGFKEFCRNKWATHPKGGGHYDIVYKRKV